MPACSESPVHTRGCFFLPHHHHHPRWLKKEEQALASVQQGLAQQLRRLQAEEAAIREVLQQAGTRPPAGVLEEDVEHAGGCVGPELAAPPTTIAAGERSTHVEHGLLSIDVGGDVAMGMEDHVEAPVAPP
eukprot:jgi/Mesvir1/23704/Mv18653-RA.1